MESSIIDTPGYIVKRAFIIHSHMEIIFSQDICPLASLTTTQAAKIQVTTITIHQPWNSPVWTNLKALTNKYNLQKNR